MTGWRLALVNRDPEKALSCKVVLAGQPLEGSHLATMLCGDSTDAYNDIDQPLRVTPEHIQLEFKSGLAELPPHSITILHIND